MLYEIVKASTSHSEDAVRAGIASERPDWNVDEIKVVDGEWFVQLSKNEKTAEKPPFLQDKDEDVPDSKDEAPDDDADDDLDDVVDDDSDSKSKDDKSDKSKSKGKGDVVSELKDLLSQLSDIVQQVSDKAGEAADETQAHRDKLDEAKNALGDEGGPEGDLPAPPLPGDALPPQGGPKPPPRPGVPSGPKSVVPGRPGVPGGGGPGLAMFTNTEVATHPGVDEKGERISLTAAATELESDPDFAAYEVVGMVENADGSYSAKLVKR